MFERILSTQRRHVSSWLIKKNSIIEEGTHLYITKEKNYPLRINNGIKTSLVLPPSTMTLFFLVTRLDKNNKCYQRWQDLMRSEDSETFD